MNTPIICFGQQPCGFFPKRYLIAKINTARALQEKIGGKIVFFYHDSDADYRETITLMRDLHTGADVRLNFTQENKLQKKHSPLYLKRISPSLNPSPQGGGKGVDAWKEEMLKQLPRFANQTLIDTFKSVQATTVADFCLNLYQNLCGLIRTNKTTEENTLLAGIEIVRSSNKNFRETAKDLSNEFFADVEYQGEIVRAKNLLTTYNLKPTTSLSLHEGGNVYTKIPFDGKLSKSQITPTAQDRFSWMQSVIHCTHYIYGQGEKTYLNFQDFSEVHPVNSKQQNLDVKKTLIIDNKTNILAPSNQIVNGVEFVPRDEINNPEYAWLEGNTKI